ncbi:hypothetical protein ACIOTI_32090 [Streptomyces sp. NPDC087843]|uniref:hypothetical protein n=1 Tax=Streptomyces sp. NPDC087843 TaxID=3365804 RepID=UPI00382263CD
MDWGGLPDRLRRIEVLAPGRHAHSVLPVSPGHTLAVLTAQAGTKPMARTPS